MSFSVIFWFCYTSVIINVGLPITYLKHTYTYNSKIKLYKTQLKKVYLNKSYVSVNCKQITFDKQTNLPLSESRVDEKSNREKEIANSKSGSRSEEQYEKESEKWDTAKR